MKKKITKTIAGLMAVASFNSAVFPVLASERVVTEVSFKDTNLAYIDLAEFFLDGFYLDLSQEHLNHLEVLDFKDLLEDADFVSEYDFLELKLQDGKVILEEIDLDENVTFILYEYENEAGYIGINATFAVKLVAITTFIKWTNAKVITRVGVHVASSHMNHITATRAGIIRNAVSNKGASHASRQAMQDTIMRRLVDSGVTSANARAVAVGVTETVRWSR
jgi:uncharacterized protein YuzE